LKGGGEREKREVRESLVELIIGGRECTCEEISAKVDQERGAALNTSRDDLHVGFVGLELLVKAVEEYLQQLRCFGGHSLWIGFTQVTK